MFIKLLKNNLLKLLFCFGMGVLVLLPEQMEAGVKPPKLTGGGIFELTDGAPVTTTFSARNLGVIGDPTAAMGQLQIVNHDTGVTVHGKIDCLNVNVDRNIAIYSGSFNENDLGVNFFIGGVMDNGTPSGSPR